MANQTKTPKTRCPDCGRKMSKGPIRCNACHIKHMNAIRAKSIEIVNTGKCPDCGAPLRYNNAITGWWQCSQYGADGYRADSSKPACSFQCSTD